MNKETNLFGLRSAPPVVLKRTVPPAYHKVVNKEIAKRRYYLHRRIVQFFPIDGANRTINISPFTGIDELNPKQQKYIREICSLGYNIQFTIPCPPKKKSNH